MTREEAIQVLKEISTTLKSWSGFSEYPQAIDMAIEALSAEPTCKNCTEAVQGGDAEMSPLQKPTTTPMQQSPSDGADLISRDDVLAVINDFYEYMGVDLHGIWNKQLAEIVKEKDADDLALDFHSLVASINALPSAGLKGKDADVVIVDDPI